MLAKQFKLRMPRNRRYCPHCRETVSSDTYLKHRKLYFDASSNSWAMKNVLAAASSDESDLENEQFLNASIYDSDEAEGKYKNAAALTRIFKVIALQISFPIM